MNTMGKDRFFHRPAETATRWWQKYLISFAILAVMLGHSAVTVAAQGCGQADVQFRGVNLAAAKWFFSPTLPPNVSADTVTSQAVPTSPLRLFDLKASGSITLFCVIEVPGATTYGALLTVGDIDGDDETYFNGRIVGTTTGRGISDQGIPRSYYIPATAFIEGRNVLAIKLKGCFGRSQAGIRREPLTLGFVPRPPAARDLPVRPAVAPAISPQEALKLVLAVDPEASGSLVQAKRPSFGRFGLMFSDGLPAVAEVGPTQIRQRAGPNFSVQLDAVENTEIAREKSDPGIDGWHKTIRVQGVHRSNPIRYTVRSHLFYPGAFFTLEEGAAVVLRVSAEAPVTASYLSSADLASVLGVKVDSASCAYIFTGGKKRTSPALVLVVNGSANLTQVGDAIDLAVARAAKSKSSPQLAICYPYGIAHFETPQGSPQWRSVVAALEPGGGDAEEILRRWLRTGSWLPSATDEYFRLLPDQTSVRVYQIARFDNVLCQESPEPPYLVLPPQLEIAKRLLAYPVKTGDTTLTRILTFSGELPSQMPPAKVRSFREKTTAKQQYARSGSLYVWYYDLPVPPLDERGLLNVAEQVELKALLNESVTDLATTVATTGVDLLYKGRAQAFQAYSFLTPENRAKLVENTRLLVPAYLQTGKWYDTVEPFSGLRFWWTYFIEGPYFDRYDQDWGNGLSLYGLYTAVKYLGEWEWIAKNWEAVERMFSWFVTTDDWEWMRASNGIHGHGTGAGDCTNATYVGVLSYAKLARETGRTEEFLYGLYAAARAAVPALTRFVYNDFARENNLLQGSRQLVVGFHEGEGFLAGELDRYPWNVTSLISGNGVQPELFDLFCKYAEQPLVNYARLFDASYPMWNDAAYQYPFRTIYRNNSGYITLPHIYLRARLRLDGPAELRQRVEKAKANRDFWWLAPPVLAEIMQPRAQAYVANWGKCTFLGGSVVQLERGRLRLEVQFDNRYPPDTVELVLPRAPRQIEINEAPVAIPDRELDGLRLRVRLKKPGLNLLTILL